MVMIDNFLLVIVMLIVVGIEHIPVIVILMEENVMVPSLAYVMFLNDKENWESEHHLCHRFYG